MPVFTADGPGVLQTLLLLLLLMLLLLLLVLQGYADELAKRG